MTDDIVNRLRSEHKTEHNGITFKFAPTKDELEAADEIEKLRAEVNIWMGVAERFAESNPNFEAFLYYFKARFQ
jgi:hypothetical protein